MGGAKERDEIIASSPQSQYLLFLLDNTLYAIEALHAQEIVEYSQITKVPMMRSFVKGVTNIRGNIVPVIDLLARFGLGKTGISSKTSIIVINLEGSEQPLQIGVMIDEVYEVDDLETARQQATPEFGSKIERRFIKGMGYYEKDYIPILHMAVILDSAELSEVVFGGEK